MNVRVAALILSFLSLVACGPTGPVPCGPTTCSGCCDSSGACVSGTFTTACGSLGNSCDVCVGTQVCAGQCVSLLNPLDAGVRDAGTSCTAETDAQLCAQHLVACGASSAVDRCGVTRSLMCGTCGPTQACAAGQCVCQPETDAQLCASAGRTCGVQALTDRCGRSRSVSCGTCAGSTSCNALGVCSCTRETDATFCARNAKSCGTVTAPDNCGSSRTVASCGTCTGPNTCAAGTCTCQGESNAQFCVRMVASCGVVTGADVCGQQRSVNCGTCSGAQTCGGGARPNLCACTPEDDATFCARTGKNCGTPAAYDNCGAWRTTANCGTCAGTQTCGGASSSNVCGCTSETNAAFLARLGKNCGSVTAPDNCGVTRTVAATASCTGTGATCGGGGVANVCGCTGESDAQLCTTAAATCGALTVTDHCGVSRSVASCGACSAPQTCGGGTTARVCGCTPETDAAFCSRKSASCGAVTSTDNCGGARTVTTCGTCSSTSVCGLTTANQCGAYAEPFDAVCNPDGWCFEQPAPFAATLNDAAANSASDAWFVGSNFTWAHWDGARWTGAFDVRRGNLSALWVSGAEVWAAGDNATVVHRVGTAWVDLPKPTSVGNLAAIHGFSASDVWVGGASAVSHWNGASWTTFAMPAAVTGLWGGATNDVWAVGNGFISRWNGAAWATQAGITWSFTDVAGASVTDVWAVASQHVMHFNGVYWADLLNDSCTSVWVGGPNNVSIACTASLAPNYAAIKTWDGTNWNTTQALAYSGARHLAGAGGALLLAVTSGGTVERRVAGSWVLVAPTQVLTNWNLNWVQTFSNGDALAFDGNSVLARTGGTWRPALTPASPYSVFGFSATDYLVGSYDSSTHYRPLANRVSAGVVMAQNLTSYAGPGGYTLRYPELDSLWAASPTDIYGVGETYYNYSSSAYYAYGAYHGDGTSWTCTLASASNDAFGTSDLFRVHGSSTTNVWAIDHGTSVWKLVGGSWARVTTGSPLSTSTGDALTGLWVQSDTKTWLGGSFGVVDFDAATGYGVKRAVPTPTLAPLPPPYNSVNPHTVRGFSSSPTLGLHAVGTSGGRGVSWAWNGTAWTVQSLFPVPVNAVDVVGNELVAVGNGGQIYRRVR